MNKPDLLKKKIAVLFESEHYIVFDKPSGLLVVPTPRKEKNTLLTIVNAQYVCQDKSVRLYPCHRLDRDTSGVIVFAKSKRYQQTMMGLFRKRQVKKAYIAFVHGKLKDRTGQIKSRIRHLEQKKFKAKTPSKWAVTEYKVKNVCGCFSVVEVTPVTGRTNQIRIHLKQAGHPLLGERKYAFAKDYDLKFRRTALHAACLEWVDPDENKRITVQSQLPNDMEVFLARNRN